MQLGKRKIFYYYRINFLFPERFRILPLISSGFYLKRGDDIQPCASRAPITEKKKFGRRDHIARNLHDNLKSSWSVKKAKLWDSD